MESYVLIFVLRKSRVIYPGVTSSLSSDALPQPNLYSNGLASQRVLFRWLRPLLP